METELFLNSTSTSSSRALAGSQGSSWLQSEPKGALEKGRKRHGSLAAGGHREVSWGNNDPVKCHLLFPQGSRMVPFQQQREGRREGIMSEKPSKEEGRHKTLEALAAPGKVLSKQDMQNMHVKGSQAMSFSILPKPIFERLGELGMSSPEKSRIQGHLTAPSSA